MANRWYVKLGDEELGPLSDAGLARLIEAGGIQGDTLVRNATAGSWTQARAVPGLLSGRRALHAQAPSAPKSPAPPGGAARTAPLSPEQPSSARAPAAHASRPVIAAAVPVPPGAAASNVVVVQPMSDAAASRKPPKWLFALAMIAVCSLAFVASWAVARLASPRPGAAGAGSADGEAQLAVLKNETVLLQQELLAARRRLVELSRPKPPAAGRELSDAKPAPPAEDPREVERGPSESPQQAEQLFAGAKAAIQRCELTEAEKLLKQYRAAGYAERRDAVAALLEELPDAAPLRLRDDVADLTEKQCREFVSTGRLPDAWPRKFADPDVAEAVRQMALRLAKVCCTTAPLSDFLHRGVADQQAYELSPVRKFQLLNDADDLDDERDLTPPAVAALVDAYGFFRVADLAPQIDSAIVTRLAGIFNEGAEEQVARLARGEIEFATLGDLLGRCRKIAGAAWPADDAPLPYAGHWISRSKWHLYVDPWRDAIVFRRSSPPAKYEQRVCKLAPGYLVAYERRVFGAVKELLPQDQDPFADENGKPDENKDDYPDLEGPAADELVALTLFVFKPGKPNTLHLYRRNKNPNTEFNLAEIKNQAFWKSLGDESLYRTVNDVYRFVDDKLSPE